MKKATSRIGLTAICLAGMMTSSALAATYTWQGGGTAYSTEGYQANAANNWVENTAPATGTAGNDYVFGAVSTAGYEAVRWNLNVTGGYNINTITLTSAAPNYSMRFSLDTGVVDGGKIISEGSGTHIFFGANRILLRGGLTFDVQAGEILVENVIADVNTSTNGSLTKNGAGVLTLNGSNTFTGNITINAGVLTLNASSTITGNIILNDGTLAARFVPDTAGTIFLNGGVLASNGTAAKTFSNDIVIGGDVGFGDSVRTGNIAFGTSSNVTLNGSHVLTIGGTRLSALSSISDGGMGYGFTKSGQGDMFLAAVNTYTGDTIVRQGNLIVYNDGLIRGDTTVENGGTLRGNGTIASEGTLTVQNGGVLAPGHLAGSGASEVGAPLKVGSLSLDAGAILQMQIWATGIDSIQATGAIAFGGDLYLDITQALSLDQSYQLFTANSFSGDFDSVTLSGGIYASATHEGSGLWSISDGTDTFYLNLSTGILAAIPEPSTYALIIGAAMFLIAGTRRRFRK